MKETIYCPRCDKTDIKTTAGKPGGELGGATNALIGAGSVAFGLLWTRAKEKRAAEYIPIYHHCESCGHAFLSLETNLEELRRAHQNKRNGLIMAILWGVLGVFLCFGGLSHIGSFLLGIVSIGLSVYGVVNMVRSGKVVSKLREQLRELEQCRQKHKSLFY